MTAEAAGQDWRTRFAKEMWQAEEEQKRRVLCNWCSFFHKEIKGGRASIDDVFEKFRDVVERYPILSENIPLIDSLVVLLEKADEEFRMNGTPVPIKRGNREVDLIRASDVAMEAIDWLWEGHLARGMQEILSGLPDLGKSQIQMQYIACATTGRDWPDGSKGCEPTNVVMLVAEDVTKQTVAPRLRAAGADLDKVFILNKIKMDKFGRAFLLSQDLDLLEDIIVQHKCGLATIDPITAFFGGKGDQHKAGDVRQQLGPLKDLAERTNVVISTITHPAKNATGRALDQFIGSQAFVAVARIGHLVMREFDRDTNEPTERYLFTVAKCNIWRKMPSRAYRMAQITVGQDEDKHMPIVASYIHWEEEVKITADQALAAGTSPSGRQGDQGKQRDAIAFLKEQLDGGPVDVKELKEAAAAHGIAWRTVERAKKTLNVKAKKTGLKGGWVWELPKAVVLKLVPKEDDDKPTE